MPARNVKYGFGQLIDPAHHELMVVEEYERLKALDARTQTTAARRKSFA